ncbi:MAG: phosphoribosylamine--glycine ligase [Ignavibacteria bacterium GWF2_33_9]|nr:MAG: phosphoribosylamine--glycine ligase [Ignavibacteria bacterium GWF2_33_9]
MKILVIGSGGREHAIVKRLSEDDKVKIYAAPGNPGIFMLAEKAKINTSEFEEIKNFVLENQIDFVFVGPEQPLADGIADYLYASNIPVFGPSKSAAEIESSKSFAKNLMQKYNIPTAKFCTFSKDEVDAARIYLENSAFPVVLKADGLAAGKGVIICNTKQEAQAELGSIFEGAFGEAGDKIVIEEFLTGEEASIFAITDGIDYVLLSSAQDHKRAFDNDMGKNTGGMGAYSPAPIVTEKMLKEIESSIIAPTIKAMEAEGRKFVGCLYAGLMITETGPKVIEFNCRFGDPETEVVLNLVEGNFSHLIYSAAKGKLNKDVVSIIQNKYSSCVVLASGGYPDSYSKNLEITGLDSVADKNTFIYHAGTKFEEGKYFTNGGRVLCVSSTGNTLQDSLNANYNAIKAINFEGMFYRKDIGQKAFKHLN